MEPSLAIAVSLLLAAGIALEFRLPSAMVEVLAGVALISFLPSVQEVVWLEFMAHLGMLSLMFVAGFDLELDKLRRNWQHCVGIGAASFAVPMAAVFAFSLFFLGLSSEGSILVAIALSTTSLALVYHALKERIDLASHTGQIVLASASVVDLLSMVSLGLLLGDVSWATAALVVAVIFTAVSLPPIGSRIFRRYRDSILEPELRFLLVVVVAIGLVGENVSGIHPAIVAFTIGVAMSGVVIENTKARDKLKGLVFGFFAPLFFIDAGMKMRIGELQASDLAVAAALLVIAVVFKYLATMWPARWIVGRPTHWIGVLFNYRMTFGIIAAEFGRQAGYIPQSMYDVLLLVILVSASLSALALRAGVTTNEPAKSGGA